MADSSPDSLDHAARLVASKHLELEAKGYSEGMVAAAIDRAWGTAARLSQKLSEDMRERAFVQLLTEELKATEGWLEGVAKKVFGYDPTEPPPTADDHGAAVGAGSGPEDE